MSAAQPEFTVLICTRDRPEMVRETLAALDAQTHGDFPIIIVDQSATPNEALVERAARDQSLELIRDEGQGLSRARNIGVAAAKTEWVAVVDDDVTPDPDWAERIGTAITEHPDASFISGYVGIGELPSADYLPVTPSLIAREATISGRRTLPWKIGLGVSFVVRKETVAALGGWDEQLGPGARFPASDDMDFNYRFLRAGGVAYVTPAIRATHRQWRTPEELVSLYDGYMVAWTGFAMKQLKSGDVVGGLLLWGWSVIDLARNLASAARRRSWLRFRISIRKLRGLLVGTFRGLRTSW